MKRRLTGSLPVRAGVAAIVFAAAVACGSAPLWAKRGTGEPNWNITYQAGSGPCAQKVALTENETQLIIDRAFVNNAAHFVIPLASVTAVGTPVKDARGVWAIDIFTSAPVSVHSAPSTPGPHPDPLATEQPESTLITRDITTSDSALFFLNEGDANDARTFLLAHSHADPNAHPLPQSAMPGPSPAATAT